jgi:hypothetical protein
VPATRGAGCERWLSHNSTPHPPSSVGRKLAKRRGGGDSGSEFSAGGDGSEDESSEDEELVADDDDDDGAGSAGGDSFIDGEDQGYGASAKKAAVKRGGGGSRATPAKGRSTTPAKGKASPAVGSKRARGGAATPASAAKSKAAAGGAGAAGDDDDDMGGAGGGEEGEEEGETKGKAVMPPGSHDHNKWSWAVGADRRDARGRSPADPGYNPRTLRVPEQFLRNQVRMRKAGGGWQAGRRSTLAPPHRLPCADTCGAAVVELQGRQHGHHPLLQGGREVGRGREHVPPPLPPPGASAACRWASFTRRSTWTRTCACGS